jgi:cellulose synthase/poly-beta-1,6-N-acetylglucosamine synthase-like glycosyltransferase
MVTQPEHTPTISVIIPVFNDPEALDACLNGIKNLAWPTEGLEVVIIDNDSKPPISISPQVYPSARVVHCSKPGSYAARNAGAREARGEVLAFIDADCIPDRDWLATSVKSLEISGDNAIIGGDVLFMPPAHPTTVTKYQLAVGFQQEKNITEKKFSATANLVVTRDAFQRIGEFEERLLSGGDREWCWRAFDLGYNLQYCKDSIVRTPPRQSLTSAIRQTRRIAAGRKHLRQLNLDHALAHGMEKHRSVWQSALWIFQLPQHSIVERIEIFTLAIFLKLVSIVESIRLMLGTQAERQ